MHIITTTISTIIGTWRARLPLNSFEELEYAGDIDNCTYFRPSPPLNIAMAGVKDWHAMLSWRKFVCTTAENQIAERGKEVQELSQQQMQMQMQLQGQQGVVSQHLQIQIAANSHQVCVFLSLSLSLSFLQAYTHTNSLTLSFTHSRYHSLTHHLQGKVLQREANVRPWDLYLSARAPSRTTPLHAMSVTDSNSSNSSRSDVFEGLHSSALQSLRSTYLSTCLCI